MNKGILLAGAILVGILAGCKSTPEAPTFNPRAAKAAPLTNLVLVPETNQLNQSFLAASTNLFTLGPGDVVELEVIGDPGTKTSTVVGPDGKIYFYLLPGVDVWGLTLQDAKSKLEQELGKYLTAPQVAIHLRMVESKRVWLLGRLQNPGIYPMPVPMTLLEAISLAGGTSTTSLSGTTEDLADLRHSFIVRDGAMLPVDFEKLLKEGDISQNIYLQPDDFVYMPSSLGGEIYVLGAVRAARTIPSSRQGTLIGAIAAAGGPIKDAYLSHVAIVRGSLAQPKIAIVNYSDIVHGRATDIRLEPHDIVFVPLSPYRFLTKYADLIVTTFVRAVAINEGARAATRNAGTVGVNIGIGP